MKILCLSDLHFTTQEVVSAVEYKELKPFTSEVHEAVSTSGCDLIVVTGDTVPANHVGQLSALFRTLFPADVPLVATLGNHEFWGHSFDETLDVLRNQTVAAPNVHYLDLEGGFQTGNVNFVGGTLFFDGSMRIRDSQKVSQWNGWQDWRITDIETNYLEMNRYYVEMIRSSMKPGISTALCTHFVPHINLNGFPPNHFSFYTGMRDLVSALSFDEHFEHALICGHTHKRVIGDDVLSGFHCVNVGSDHGKLETFVLEM
ncbi:MAG: metallophosphoesterase [Thermoguttaceae bacterium]|nr:metallophosphoesterase [Thermoguttaceae bacterium]